MLRRSGDNVISATAKDGVCSLSTADAKSELTIRARKPISYNTRSPWAQTAKVGLWLNCRPMS